MATTTGHSGWSAGNWAERLSGLPGPEQGGLTDEEKAEAHMLIERLPTEASQEKAVPKIEAQAITYIKFRLKFEHARQSTKRPHTDTSAEYLRRLLEPELTELPRFEDLPEFIRSSLKHKLPALDSAYYRAWTRYPQVANLLFPLNEEPGPQDLATKVGVVLDGRLQDVDAENTLHYDVDGVFDRMFRFASDVGLLKYRAERNKSDTLSGTTGRLRCPDYLLWVNRALLFKGEEKAHAVELYEAETELLTKMTSAWDSRVYGKCPYMLGYAVGGNLLKIVAIMSGQRQDLIDVDMATVPGKLDALVAVINIIRLLRAMAKRLPQIDWGIGQSFTVMDADKVISVVTNMGDHVVKELQNFEDRYRQYAPPGTPPLQFLQRVYKETAGARHLIQAIGQPTLSRSRVYTVKLQPVGVAYRIRGPQGAEEAKLAIKGVLLACSELHARGFVHRDLRWPNVIKVTDGGAHTIRLIDLELAGEAGTRCAEQPYPLQHWQYDDGRSVLETDGTYTCVSDLRMVGRQLLGTLNVDQLGDLGHDLKQKLEAGEYTHADAALEHAWFSTT